MIYMAKCKLCQSILNPREGDYITCRCGEITLDGLKKAVVCEKSIENYIEIDDNGNEIKEGSDKKESIESLYKKPCKQDLFVMLDEMIDGIERLPTAGLYAPCTNQDLVSALILISACLRADS